MKDLVLSNNCLTVIHHENPEDQNIFMTCDASNEGTGAILLFDMSYYFHV